jgi:hypothetical protein
VFISAPHNEDLKESEKRKITFLFEGNYHRLKVFPACARRVSKIVYFLNLSWGNKRKMPLILF